METASAIHLLFQGTDVGTLNEFMAHVAKRIASFIDKQGTSDVRERTRVRACLDAGQRGYGIHDSRAVWDRMQPVASFAEPISPLPLVS